MSAKDNDADAAQPGAFMRALQRVVAIQPAGWVRRDGRRCCVSDPSLPHYGGSLKFEPRPLNGRGRYLSTFSELALDQA